MPDIAGVLKEEITRLARKEMRASVDPLKKQVVELRRRLRDAEGQIRKLQKSTKRAVEVVADQTGAIVADGEETRQIRVSADSVQKLRSRLRLTQGQMAQLLGVSTNTIVRWEHGTSSPRGGSREAIAVLRGLGIREVRERLEKLAGT